MYKKWPRKWRRVRRTSRDRNQVGQLEQDHPLVADKRKDEEEKSSFPRQKVVTLPSAADGRSSSTRKEVASFFLSQYIKKGKSSTNQGIYLFFSFSLSTVVISWIFIHRWRPKGGLDYPAVSGVTPCKVETVWWVRSTRLHTKSPAVWRLGHQTCGPSSTAYDF